MDHRQRRRGSARGGDSLYEAATISELWAVAHGQESMASFLLVHGFHGPAEGELSSLSWGEDPSPLGRLIES